MLAFICIVSPGKRRCFVCRRKINVNMFEDEFEEFRARASSGGMLDLSSARAARDRARAVAKSRETKPHRHIQQQSKSRDDVRENAAMTREYVDETPPYAWDSRSCGGVSPPQVRTPDHSHVFLSREWDLGDMRPRTRSAPGTRHFCRKNALLKPPLYVNEDEAGLYRLRQFTVTRKGVVNRGDCFRVRSTPSIASTGSAHSGSDDEYRTGSSTVSLNDSPAANAYSVRVLGQSGVGKTVLVSRFVTSDIMDSRACSFDAESEQSVSVSVDGEESYVTFTESPRQLLPDAMGMVEEEIDGFLVVFSLTDTASFEAAMDLVCKLRNEEHYTGALILVANKSDLVRSRHISEEEGKDAAKEFECKYTEVSALLNHKVDELLVGILRQIRLKSKRKKKHSCKVGCAKDVMTKFFHIDRIFSKSCENMMVL